MKLLSWVLVGFRARLSALDSPNMDSLVLVVRLAGTRPIAAELFGRDSSELREGDLAHQAKTSELVVQGVPTQCHWQPHRRRQQ